MKKKIYYNMRFKNIARNFSFFTKLLKICKKSKLTAVNDRIWGLYKTEPQAG